MPGLEADERLDVELGERLGALGGDLLDVHASCVVNMKSGFFSRSNVTER